MDGLEECAKHIDVELKEALLLTGTCCYLIKIFLIEKHTIGDEEVRVYSWV